MTGLAADNDASRVGPATVLVLVPFYLPAYKAGGCVRSVANIVSTFAGIFPFKVATLDRDRGDESPYAGVVENQWSRVGHSDVMYLRPGWRGLIGMFALLRAADQSTVLYLNSFFARIFSMLPMLMRRLKLCRVRRVVLAPRGELSLGALQLKGRRKRLYIRIARCFGLYRDIVWHASTELEEVDIRRQFPRTTKVACADVITDACSSNISKTRSGTSVVLTALDVAGPVLPVPWKLHPKIRGQLRVVFVSRISRAKNLSGALTILKGVSGDISFDIYGPAEDAGYWEECQGLIAALPANIRVRYCGEIAHESVAQVFAEQDLFLFPTLGENYGHVICEALASGCPVLISDQTPWRNLEAEGVGWDIPLSDLGQFRSVLQTCVDGDDEWYASLSRRAQAYAIKCNSDPNILEANRRLFQYVLASQ
jgi:glycosyltransferase involved in cell wall biosynthesis